MKKIFAMMIALVMMASVAVAQAEDLGIQVIGGPETESIPMSLDDMQLGQIYTIDGYAKVEPVEFMFADFFAQFIKDADYAKVGGNGSSNSDQVFVDKLSTDWWNNWRWWDAGWQDSGMNAEFAWFMVDLTNLKKAGMDFMEDVSVKVVYQDEYEFAGWVRQINYDYLNYGAQGRNVCRKGIDTICPNVVVLNPENVEIIDMMYTGTYAFGCTLPNSVVEDTKSPLRIEIKLGDNDLTYNIRK